MRNDDDDDGKVRAIKLKGQKFKLQLNQNERYTFDFIATLKTRSTAIKVDLPASVKVRRYET